MKFMERSSNKVRVGDLVNYEGDICIIVYIPDVYIEDLGGKKCLEFPYQIISLNSGRSLNGFRELEDINASRGIIFLSKNEDVQVSY